ncbi:MAG: hypothetical protein ASARMPRED_001189 [Alectoria sarmentosa]|nr:MAG: hypothetical protein ASARMPRED_001189 [Alectoria sarmentosa]
MSDGIVQPEWPLRLLHVPTMTSLERQEGNIYGDFVEPDYSILSYTWGRWAVAHGNPALEVRGVTWRIPAIDEKHFSATQLQRAIWNISLGEQSENEEHRSNIFVWIDIACIDQENERIKAVEIGRQAAIFGNAKRAYIWLSHLDESELSLCDEVLYDSSETLFLASGDEELNAVDIDTWTESFVRLLEVLLQDPWYTSLWTLQEMFLRADAAILSKSAEIVKRKAGNGNSLSLGNLVTNCTSVYNELTRRVFSRQQIARSSTYTKILSLIERLGLYHGPWENPILLYGAARHRTTRDPKDRVYGIMQVYGFRLGSSAQPDRGFTLADLELQLAMAHNVRSAVSAQLFVHTRIIEVGNCWRMDSHSKLPQTLLMLTDTDRRSLGEISFENSRGPRLRAKACHLRDIANVWMQACSPLEYNAVQNILLDVTAFSEEKIPPGMHEMSHDDARQHDLSSLLVDSLSDEARVFLLGVLVDAVDEDVDILVGLIAEPQENGTTLCWQRIGICLWESIPETSWEGLGGLWSDFDGFLG